MFSDLNLLIAACAFRAASCDNQNMSFSAAGG